jgi:hypothetical protein
MYYWNEDAVIAALDAFITGPAVPSHTEKAPTPEAAKEPQHALFGMRQTS